MTTFNIGILGGGQLALMLVHAAERMGFKPTVLAGAGFDPAVQSYKHSVLGSIHDEEILESFFSQAKQVLFENEFVDCEKLSRVAAPFGVKFFPGLGAIERLQNKLSQKKILKDLGIPTAPFVELDLEEELSPQLSRLSQKFEQGFVLKWATLGYDGKGVFLVRELNSEISKKAALFVEQAKKRGGAVFAEERIDFKRELAIIGVYSIQSEFQAYPLVISEQKEGICSRVYGPAVSYGVSQKNETLARRYAQAIASSTGLFGCFGVEFFETQTGELLVNEIAPRVHNSGHYTQDACATDQFENHWRAILGWPLGATDSTAGFAMLNILGPSVPVQNQENYKLPVPGPRSHVHWYGKKGISPGRKLGHLNGVVTDTSEMESLLRELAQIENNWIESLRRTQKGTQDSNGEQKHV